MLVKESGQPLTLQFIRSIDRTGRFGDGYGSHGLSILAKRNAAGGINLVWSQRTLVDGEEKTFGLGSYPLVTLKMARAKAFDNARRIALGEDLRKPKRHIPTVAEAFDQVMELKRPSWKGKRTEDSWNDVKKFCQPILSKRISDVNVEDVTNILKPIWHEKPATATSVQSRLSAVMGWAKEMEFRLSNPASMTSLQSLGSQPKSTPHRAAPYDELGTYLAQIRDADIWWGAKYCLLFIAFTVDRSEEARESTWDEINLKKEIWTLSAERMKADEEHTVPLPRQALEILDFAKSKGIHSKGYIFHAKRSSNAIGGGILSKPLLARGMPFTPHGIRSSFRDWAGERDDINQDAAEVSIAHSVGGRSKKSYLRTRFLPQRRKLMQEWADYLTETMGPVISEKDMDTADVSGLTQALNQLFNRKTA